MSPKHFWTEVTTDKYVIWSFKSHPPLLPVSMSGRRQCPYLIVKRIQRQYREIKKVKWEFIFARIHSEEEWVDRWGKAVLHLFVCLFLTSQLWRVYKWRGTSCSSVGKESACNERVPSLISVLGRSPGGGHGNPLQYFCLETPHGQRNLAYYCP